MSLDLAIKHALINPIKARGRNSISRFAAVLTDGSSVFIGTNSYRTFTLQAKFSKNQDRVCRHAEIHALSKAIKGRYRDLSEYTIYVARVLADGSPALARPCEVCESAIKYYGVGKVIHT